MFVSFASQMNSAMIFAKSLVRATTVGFVVLASVSVAQADSYGPAYERFSATVRGEHSFALQETVVDAGTLKVLSEIAKDQAQIWGDTILEGDYLADGKTRLDRIEAVVEGGTLIGYRITYSERAWRTLHCGAVSLSEVQGCTEGRIVESTFVSRTLCSWLRDDNAYADFTHLQ